MTVTAIRPGECFSDFEETRTGLYVRRSSCTTPHQGEVGAEGELPDIPYPGERETADRAWTVCRERTEFLERSRYGSDLKLHVAPPDEDAWKDGRRSATCVMVYKGSGLLPSPLAQTMDTKSRYESELSPGDCVKKWNYDGVQPIIACTEEHEFEVLAVYTMQGGKYPGDKGMEKKVTKDCLKFAREAWGRTRPPISTSPTWSPTRTAGNPRGAWASAWSRAVTDL
ncbi:septum formation family protein [Actinomadura luteofluorescens]|uniref:septum formation family protein n=1 Tax=Actinomadura luteofluorescens TaxID=46163 RepID=UPI00363A01AE